jgi:hypothetical protein
MRDECEAAMAEVLGRELRPGEAREVESMVSLQMRLAARRDPAAWSRLSPDQRIQQGAEAAAQAMLDAVKLKQRRVELQIAAHDRIEGALAQRFEALDSAGAKPGSKLKAVSDLLAFNPAGGGFASAETWAHAIANEALGRLTPLWDSVKGFAHLFEDTKGVSDVVHELFGEESGNAAAKAGAKAWLKVTDDLRDRANAAGMDIGKLDEWHYPQSHSQARIATAGGDASAALERWSADTLPLLDRTKYIHDDGSMFSDAEMQEFLRYSFDSIVTDGQNKAETSFKRQTAAGQPSATYGGRGGYGPLANRNNASRQIFFKDADSYLHYQGLYGDRNLWSVLTGHIRSISRDIGLIETLGPNAEQTFRYFNDRTLLDEKRQFPTSKAKINTAATLNESLFDYVAGKRVVVNDKVAAAGQAFRNFETAAKLGRVVITALGDEAGMAATAFANKVPWSESLMRELTYLNPANAEDRSVAAHAGLGINGMMGGLNRFGYEDLQLAGGEGLAAGVRNLTSKTATGVLQMSGAEAMWDARRRALGSVLMSYLGKTTREVEHFADINVQDHGMLATKGVTENDWQLWRVAEPEDWGMKHGVLTPKSIWGIPDERIADLNLGDPTALKRHASTMLLGHILEETGMGVMDTGARERARALFGTQAGTVWGELARSTMLFKSFSFSMMMKHWARAASLPSGSATASYVTRLLVAGTVMGALATQIRNVTSGKDPANMAEPKFWGESFLRGGGLGFYGDFLYAEVTQHDTSLIPAVVGPLATESEQLWNLTGAAAFKAARGERTDEGAKLVRFARSNIPFLNMWYTQAAMDHLVWNEMQETASPGFLDRMQAKAYAERGTTNWWNPQEATPSRAPDLQAMWQPDRGAEQMQRIASALSMEEQ